MKEKEIAVFIVEDERLIKELLRAYFYPHSITYACYFKQLERGKIVEALNKVQ